jgi:hypothetical protein
MYSRIRDPGSGAFSPLGSGIRIRDKKKFRDPDPGSGIKHPGSATLVLNYSFQFCNAFLIGKQSRRAERNN